MTKILSNFFLAGDKFIPELHVRQPGFTCSACGPFTKHQERIQKFKETGNLKQPYRNELDKTCFTHDAEYSNSKDLAEKTISDKVLKERISEIARNPKCNRYQRWLASIVYKFLTKKRGQDLMLMKS